MGPFSPPLSQLLALSPSPHTSVRPVPLSQHTLTLVSPPLNLTTTNKLLCPATLRYTLTQLLLLPTQLSGVLHGTLLSKRLPAPALTPLLSNNGLHQPIWSTPHSSAKSMVMPQLVSLLPPISPPPTPRSPLPLTIRPLSQLSPPLTPPRTPS